MESSKAYKTTWADDIPLIVERARTAFTKGITKPVYYRRNQLKSFLKMLSDENTVKLLTNALYADLRKPEMESYLSEIVMIKNEVIYALDNLAHWTKDEYPCVSLANRIGDNKIRKEPYGVVCIIAPWNFPLNLLLSPMVGAIAAGNAVVLKPSEVSANTARVLADILPKYLDPVSYKIVHGGPKETTILLQQKFDYIFFTGSSQVGKVIMNAAVKQFCPVTLELGGKSPVIVTDDADPYVAARRIAFGKFMNAGQTCVAPDYILCSLQMQALLAVELVAAIKEFYGEHPETSTSYGRIISDSHFKRLHELCISDLQQKNATLVTGGIVYADLTQRYFPPTVLQNVARDSKVMQEELFGPILPIVVANDIKSAVDFVNSREKPLALYVFASRHRSIDYIVTNTDSGGVCVNDTIMQLSESTLPFGGVGSSGMGRYHGKYSFNTFTHQRTIVTRSLGPRFLEKANQLRYPPYSQTKLKWLKWLLQRTPSRNLSTKINIVLAFIVVAFCISYRNAPIGILIDKFRSS